MVKKNYITVLNVFSALAVVFLHANGCFWQFSTERYWATANIIESFFYFAVPVFFMITGATLIDYRERYDTKTFFKKRLLKTLIPYICFVAIGIIYGMVKGDLKIEQNIILYFVNSLFVPKYPSIYWFFIPLFTAYMCIPVISLIPKEKRQGCFKYIIVLFIVFKTVALIFGLSGVLNYNSALCMPFAANYIFYLFLGYYIANYDISKNLRYVIYILGVLGLLLQIIGTYVLSMKLGAISTEFKGYMGLPCILNSMAIFLFSKNVDFEKHKVLLKICSFFKAETFGIYLVHWYIINICMVVGLPTKSIIFRTVGAVAIFVVSALIVKLIRKVPVIKNLVP